MSKRWGVVKLRAGELWDRTQLVSRRFRKKSAAYEYAHFRGYGFCVVDMKRPDNPGDYKNNDND